MDAQLLIEKIIDEGKWVKNDIGMWKIQCAKLVRDKGDLLLILVSDKAGLPVSCRVESALIVHEELILFYDKEYSEKVEKNEQHRYKELLTEKEWNIVFEEKVTEKLIKNNMVSEKLGFYAEPHETMKQYLQNDYDLEVSNKICERYNLKEVTTKKE